MLRSFYITTAIATDPSAYLGVTSKEQEQAVNLEVESEGFIHNLTMHLDGFPLAHTVGFRKRLSSNQSS